MPRVDHNFPTKMRPKMVFLHEGRVDDLPPLTRKIMTNPMAEVDSGCLNIVIYGTMTYGFITTWFLTTIIIT